MLTSQRKMPLQPEQPNEDTNDHRSADVIEKRDDLHGRQHQTFNVQRSTFNVRKKSATRLNTISHLINSAVMPSVAKRSRGIPWNYLMPSLRDPSTSLGMTGFFFIDEMARNRLK